MTGPPEDVEAHVLLNAYVDNELDAASSLAFVRRLAREPALMSEHDRIVALRPALRDALGADTAPAGLRDRIVDAVGLAAPRPLFEPRRIETRRPSWYAMAAALVLAAGFGSASTYVLTGHAPDEAAVDAVVAGHVRGLIASHSTDVDSSDRHTVKPWFAGRLSFAPQVPDLATDGFPLAGGRIDVIGGRPAGTLVYRRRQHLISLTAVPEDPGVSATAARRTSHGFSILGWTQDGVAYWAVSNLAMTEMDEFERLFRARAASQ